MRSSIPWLLVAALGALAYLNGLTGEFVYDDNPYVVESAQVQEGGLGEAFGQPLGSPHQGLYRPLAVLTYQWQARGRGAEAPTLPFHLLNVAFHVVVSLLVVTFSRTVGIQRGTAFLAGALFAVHPVHVESVTWIVGRAELIGAALGIAFFLVARRHGTWVAAPVWFLACLGKEGALVWPGILLLDDWLRAPRELRPGRLLLRYLPLCITLGLIVALRFAVLGRFGPDLEVAPFRDLPLGVRALVSLNLLGSYLHLAVFPWPCRLFYHYTEFVTPSGPALMAVIAAVGLVFWFRHRKPVLFLLLAFVLSLAPFLALRPIQETFAERFLYLPTVFICPLLAMLLWAPLDRERRRTGRVGLSLAWPAVVLTAGLAGSWALNGRYRDALTLWEASARVAPDLPFPRYQLGYFLQSEGIFTARDRWRGAVAEYTTALERHQALVDAGYRGMPVDQEARAHLNLGVILHRLLPRGQQNLPRAEQHIRRAEELGRQIEQLDDEWARALYELALMRRSPTVSLQEAEHALRQAETLHITEDFRGRIHAELEKVRQELSAGSSD